MSDLTIKLSDIIWACTAITALVGAYKLMTKPYADMAKKVEKHDAAIEKQNEALTTILKCLSAIINHDIDGNNIDGLKATRDELTSFMAKK